MRNVFCAIILVFLFFSLGLYQEKQNIVNHNWESVCSINSAVENTAENSYHAPNIKKEQDKSFVSKSASNVKNNGLIKAVTSSRSLITAARSLIRHKKVADMTATAYTHTGNPTYTGVYPRIGTIAVDPKEIPLGSKMWVEGYGYGIAQDTGGSIKGKKIDLFMETKQECFNWGRRKVKVYLLE